MSHVDDHGHQRPRYVDRKPLELEPEPFAPNIRQPAGAESASVPGDSGAEPPAGRVLGAPLPAKLRNLIMQSRARLNNSPATRSMLRYFLADVDGDQVRALSAAQAQTLCEDVAMLLDVAKGGPR